MDTNLDTRTKRHYVLTSFVIYFSYIAYGVNYNIWGPTWIDLMNLLDSTQEAMAYGLSLMSIGYTIGALSGGFIFNYLNRQLLLCLYLLLMASTTTLAPILKSYTMFLIISLFFGFGEGGFDTACNSWIMEMWKSENGPYMQALHFTFGLGSLLAPLIDMNFLDDSNRNSNPSSILADNNNITHYAQHGAHHHNYVYSSKLLLLSNRDNVSDVANGSRIYIPYSITGGLLTLSSILMFLMYIFKPYQPMSTIDDSTASTSEVTNVCSTASINYSKESDDEKQPLLANEETNKSEKSRKYLISMVTIGAIMFCFYAGMENINFEYLATFTVSTKLNLSEETSALMMSGLSAAYTLGRGIGIVIAIKVEPKYFLYLNFLFISSATVIIYTFADTSQSMLFFGLILLGLGFSTVYPCIFSYLEQHFSLTNFICGIFTFASASTSVVDPIIIGRYIKNYPFILLYLNITSIVLVVLSFLTFEISTKIKKINTNSSNRSYD